MTTAGTSDPLAQLDRDDLRALARGVVPGHLRDAASLLLPPDVAAELGGEAEPPRARGLQYDALPEPLKARVSDLWTVLCATLDELVTIEQNSPAEAALWNACVAIVTGDGDAPALVLVPRETLGTLVALARNSALEAGEDGDYPEDDLVSALREATAVLEGNAHSADVLLSNIQQALDSAEPDGPSVTGPDGS